VEGGTAELVVKCLQLEHIDAGALACSEFYRFEVVTSDNDAITGAVETNAGVVDDLVGTNPDPNPHGAVSSASFAVGTPRSCSIEEDQ
jgi:hypothetical protein